MTPLKKYSSYATAHHGNTITHLHSTHSLEQKNQEITQIQAKTHKQISNRIITHNKKSRNQEAQNPNSKAK